MATEERPATVSEGKKELTKRDRAFLGQLPDDFLRIQEVSRAEQTTQSGQRDHPHLVPMSFHGQGMAAGGHHVGKLKVTIAQAKLVKNYGFTRMDPYCRVRIGHAVYETPTDVSAGKNPRWNKSFAVNLGKGVNSLYVEIFNERYLSLDDRIAWGYLEFSDDLYSGEVIEEWVALTGKQGDEKEGNINLILTLQKPQANYYTTYSPGPATVIQQPGGYNPYPTGYIQQPAYFQQQPPPPQQQVPPPQPQRRQITDEEVRQLQEMFPDADTEVVRSVLEACNGNSEQAVSNLLSMTAT